MPYQNPYNLYYCLSGLPFTDSFKILKQDTISTDFFSVDAAIIGSSHFLKINNDLFEILTCQQISQTNLHIKKLYNISDKKICIQEKSAGFIYDFTLTSQKLSEAEFDLFLKKYQSEEHWLQYTFHKEHALTVIDKKISDNGSIIFTTLHSYPESNTIIETSTILLPD